MWQKDSYFSTPCISDLTAFFGCFGLAAVLLGRMGKDTPWITGSGWCSLWKDFKMPFVSRYQKFLLLGNSNGCKTSPKFFSIFFQQIWPLEDIKVFGY